MQTSGAGVPTVLAGRYLLGGELGQGGAAVVLRARDTVLHRDVAVKILHSVIDDEQARDRFQIEGETLGRLHHPGLVTVFDAGVDGGRPFLVMELVDGETLARRCRAEPLDPAEVLTIGVQLAAALEHVHRHGVIHRDVKPGNVLIGADGRVRLADFGVARALESTATVTAPGTAIGTPAYLAPEQVRGEPGSTAIDVYSLALVLLEALSGEPAYTGAPHVAAYARLVTPPSVDGVPTGLRELLARMTASDPAARPTARQVGARLASLMDGAETVALTAELPIAPAWRDRRVPVRRVAMLAAAGALIGGGLIGSQVLGDGGSPAPGSAGVGPAAPSSTAGTAAPNSDQEAVDVATSVSKAPVGRRIARPGAAKASAASSTASGEAKPKTKKNKGKGHGSSS